VSGRNRSASHDSHALLEDDELHELDLTTQHCDVAYWYSSYEDPNCLAVVELVATEVDRQRGIEVHILYNYVT
jgi:hypothetical protein